MQLIITGWVKASVGGNDDDDNAASRGGDDVDGYGDGLLWLWWQRKNANNTYAINTFSQFSAPIWYDEDNSKPNRRLTEWE